MVENRHSQTLSEIIGHSIIYDYQQKLSPIILVHEGDYPIFSKSLRMPIGWFMTVLLMLAVHP